MDMENFYELEGLVPKLNKSAVLKAMDCYEDSPVYEEVSEEYEEICEEMLKLTKPVGILGFGTLPEGIETKKYKAGTPVIYAVISIGDGISKCSTRGFQEGDYVKGMLCDAIADEALFSLEGRMVEKLQEICREHKVGILKRLEAPHDIPVEVQKAVWDQLELKKRFGIEISSGFMYNPVKTSCQVFVLTEDESVFKAHHDCRKCPNINEGAICSVTIRDRKAEIRTIQDKPAVGICGTGVVETAMELVKEELVDETGLMDEEYFDDGFPLAQTEDGRTIVFTAKDVREIQLAKAAVRAGVEILLLRYGIEKEQVSRVYLAGGFGYKLDKDKAIAIGMLPGEFRDRIEAVGNSSLSGAVKYLKDAEGKNTLSRLAAVSSEVNLSKDKDFNEFYMDNMMFGEE